MNVSQNVQPPSHRRLGAKRPDSTVGEDVRGSIAGRARGLLIAMSVAALLGVGVAAPAGASAGTSRVTGKPAVLSASEGQALQTALMVLPGEYASAVPTHDATLAAVTRALAGRVRDGVLTQRGRLAQSDPASAALALESVDRLVTLLAPTSVRLQPWPLALEVAALSERAERTLDAFAPPRSHRSDPYAQIESALDRVEHAARGGHVAAASLALTDAYALYAAGPGLRLRTADPTLDARITREELLGDARSLSLADTVARGGDGSALSSAISRVRSEMKLTAQTLGEVRIAHATIVADAAIIVFREGLEAVLILAAITASFVGARRHLRKPVLLGGLAGLVATALTWLIAQVILHLLGDGGLELQAVTGLIAIVVLLLVTNWFFHRVYWSEWISRFNRRRRAIERWDRLGFVSGQVLGLLLLGLSSVYREGLETVLFLQAMQSSAGTATTALGAGIGLAGTLVVGTITFGLQHKLPFKRMLVVTGALIALVLAVMLGTTVHTMQAIGWLPTTPTGFGISATWSQWLGLYATWEGIAAQLLALVFVVGSYLAARELRVKRPRRRSERAARAVAAVAAQGGTR